MSTYELRQRIGEGGMGTVFEALRTLPNGEQSRVACKSIRDEVHRGPREREQFFREARLNLDISHNHRGLVSVLDCVEGSDGKSHLVMEFVEGCSLLDLQCAFGRLPWDVLRLVATEVLDALAYLHEHKIVHRDISPCNVLVSRTGEIKLSDLGLAKRITAVASAPGRFRGKWPYAPPEVIGGARADRRSDLFSFAAMLFELITGDVIYGDVDSLASVSACLHSWEGPRLPDDVPTDLRALIEGLTSSDPTDRRPRSARAAMEVVRAFDAGDTRGQIAEMAGKIYTWDARARAHRVRSSDALKVDRMITHGRRVDVHVGSVRFESRENEPTVGAGPGRRRRTPRRGLMACAVAMLLGWSALGDWSDQTEHRESTGHHLDVESSTTSVEAHESLPPVIVEAFEPPPIVIIKRPSKKVPTSTTNEAQPQKKAIRTVSRHHGKIQPTRATHGAGAGAQLPPPPPSRASPSKHQCYGPFCYTSGRSRPSNWTGPTPGKTP